MHAILVIERRVFAETIKEFGDLDILINNAGIGEQKMIDETDDDWMIYKQKEGDGASLVKRIESLNGLHTLEHAEEIGLGKRVYKIVNVD